MRIPISHIPNKRWSRCWARRSVLPTCLGERTWRRVVASAKSRCGHGGSMARDPKTFLLLPPGVDVARLAVSHHAIVVAESILSRLNPLPGMPNVGDFSHEGTRVQLSLGSRGG